MLWLIGKTVFLYFIVIIIIRLLGKSAFAQLTAHDMAGIFFVITIASGPIVTDHFGHTITALVTVSLVHIGISRLMLLNRLKKLFIGEPAIVIKHGNLVKENLQHFHITLSELLSELREKGYPDIASIDYAIIEPYGGISIVPKQEVRPVTSDQLNLAVSYQGLPITVIVEGSIQQQNLTLINRDKQWLMHELEKAGFSGPGTIFYGAVREFNHSLVIDDGTGDTG
ncbi:DUF421 domain-containing protein [Barrientosiimonas marina]|uniref:DUF421 domain-containing protein n=1 Tax=Lentibacillus kimchii TaxID=1542911 RepID=A0ABW2UV79_9BACI